MPTIFISHSNQDHNLVYELEKWLETNGFDDYFSDHHSIRGGDKWAEELRRATSLCRVVICLITKNWLASTECYAEFLAAFYLGKRIVPLFRLPGPLEDTMATERLRRVQSEDQGFCLPADTDLFIVPQEVGDGLRAGLRAGGALARIGLDPAAFEIDSALRPSPFPGLESFGDEDADAAIFYGRSVSIARCIEELREMRATGQKHIYALVGTSGSGKSSLLKAGVLPRLRRERSWLVARSFTPGADPLLALADAMVRTFTAGTPRSMSGGIRDELLVHWVAVKDRRNTDWPSVATSLVEKFRGILSELIKEPDPNRDTMLLAIDQAEALIRSESKSALAVCDYIAALLLQTPMAGPSMGVPPYTIVALTVRSDQLDDLQASAGFVNVRLRSTDIRPLPLFRVPEVIEAPAARYGVTVDKSLVDVILEKMPDNDALPLVAFALERMWHLYRQGERLPLAAYNAVGGLDGLLEAAAERALRGVDPKDDRSALLPLSPRSEAIAAGIFVPPLAQIDNSGSTTRRVTAWESFGDDAKAVLRNFVAWRLLVVRGGEPAADGGAPIDTVEVAHEAMFRSWPRLTAWIAREKRWLQELRDLQASRRDWMREGLAPEYCVHRGARLRAAKQLLRMSHFKPQIVDLDERYISACKKLARRRTGGRIFAAICTAFGAAAAAGAIQDWTAQAQLRNIALDLIHGGYPTLAAKFAIGGARKGSPLLGLRGVDADAELVRETGMTLKLMLNLPTPFTADAYQLSKDGQRLILRSDNHAGDVWDTKSGQRIIGLNRDGQMRDFYLPDDEKLLIIRGADDSVSAWDTTSGKNLLTAPAKTMNSGDWALSAGRLVTLSEDGTCILWDMVSGQAVTTLGKPDNVDAMRAISMNANSRIVTRSRQNKVDLWSAVSGAFIVSLDSDGNTASIDVKKETARVLLLSTSGEVSLFDAITGSLITHLAVPGKTLGWSFSSTGTRLITRSSGNRLSLWNTLDGRPVAAIGTASSTHWEFSNNGRLILVQISNGGAKVINAEDGTVVLELPGPGLRTFEFSKEGNRLAVIAYDGTATLWDVSPDKGRQLAVLAGADLQTRYADAVEFSPNGDRLSVASNNSPGSLWDSAVGKRIAAYDIQGDGIRSVFSKNGRLFATSGSNNTGSLFDGSTGARLATIGGSGAVYATQLSEDGEIIATQSSAYSAAVWSTTKSIHNNKPSDQLAQAVCELNYRTIGRFDRAELANEDNPAYAVRWALIGRPWSPCDWRGMGTAEGWQQEIRYWLVRAGLAQDYVCGETTAGLFMAVDKHECLANTPTPAGILVTGQSVRRN